MRPIIPPLKLRWLTSSRRTNRVGAVVAHIRWRRALQYRHRWMTTAHRWWSWTAPRSVAP